MAQLGNTLEQIAYQKAGIIKCRVPVVSGVVQDGPRAVVRKAAAKMNAPVWAADSSHRDAGGYRLALIGIHQVDNAAVACATIERLRVAGIPICENAIIRGLAEVRWPARIERISSNPVVVLDTAHNVPSIEALVQTLHNSFPSSGTRRVVFAVSSDKQYSEMLRALASYFDHFYLTRYGDNPRSVPPDKLAALLVKVAPGKQFSIHATSLEAWSAARAAATPVGLICITGSVFLAGELRHYLTHFSTRGQVPDSPSL